MNREGDRLVLFKTSKGCCRIAGGAAKTRTNAPEYDSTFSCNLNNLYSVIMTTVINGKIKLPETFKFYLPHVSRIESRLQAIKRLP
jgi:hypothetical protein